MIQSFYGSQAFPPKYNSPHRVRESKTVLDSGFHTMDSGFQIPDSSLCRWNLGSGFQSLVEFRIVRIQKPRIPDSTAKIFPDSGFHKQKIFDSGIHILVHVNQEYDRLPKTLHRQGANHESPFLDI